jgi:hypothetical protein
VRLAVIIVLALSTVSALAQSPAPVSRDETITLQLGSISFDFEKWLLIGRPSPTRVGSLSREKWAAMTHYEMSLGQHISVQVISFPAHLSCGDTFKSAVLERVTFYPDPPMLVVDRHTVPTQNPRISRLIPPPHLRELYDQLVVGIQGLDKIEGYQFEDDDLRDFRGAKQTFDHFKDVFPETPSIVKMRISVAPEVTVAVSFSSPSFECFIREGPDLTRHVRNFFLERMKTSP